MEIPEAAASVLDNMYKIRRKLQRRLGQAQLGAGNLSPNQDLNALQWAALHGTEYLIAAHNTNLVDFFNATVGAILPGGTARLTNSDVNAAVVNQRLYLGDGTSQNVRFDPVATLAQSALQLTATNSQYLEAAAGGALYTGQDLTVAGWVNLDSVGADRTIASIFDITTASAFSFVLGYDTASTKFVFKVAKSDFSGTLTQILSSVTPVVGTWYFVAGRHDSVAHTLSISINGAAPQSVGYANGLAEPVRPFRVGALYNAPAVGSAFWDGKVQDLGFWRSAASGGGALTNAQITALYDAGVPLAYQALSAAQKVALVPYWNLGEPSGNRADGQGAYALTPQPGAALPGNTPGLAASIGGVAQVGQPKAASTLAAARSGPGQLTAGGTYSWLVSFVNLDGAYGEPCDTPVTFTIILASGNSRVNVSSIPTSPDPDVSGRILWRLDPGATVYKQVTFIQNNTSTSFDDNVAQTSLGQTLIFGNTRFPPCKYLIEHQNRMVGAWCTTSEGDKQTLFISNVLQPYYCPAAPDLTDPNQGTRAQMNLQGFGGGEITGLCSHGGMVAAFTGGSGNLLLGVEPNSFRLQKFSEHGCVAHRTIKSSRHLLIWLAPDGVYAWDGAKVERISDDVRDTILGISAADLAKAHAFVWYDRYYLCWPSGCLWYDMMYRVWGRNTNNLWRTSSVTVFTSTQQQRIYASELGNARVRQLETGATDAGTPIPTRWVSRAWEMGMPSHEKRVHLCEAKWKKTSGTATVNLYTGSGNLIQTFTQDISVPDSSSDSISKLLQGAVEQARAEHFTLEVLSSTTDASYELLSAGLWWTLSL